MRLLRVDVVGGTRVLGPDPSSRHFELPDYANKQDVGALRGLLSVVDTIIPVAASRGDHRHPQQLDGHGSTAAATSSLAPVAMRDRNSVSPSRLRQQRHEPVRVPAVEVGGRYR